MPNPTRAPDALLAALIATPAGSRELDAIVAVAANWRHPLYVNDRWPQIYNEWKDTGRIAEKAQDYGVPKFTTSVDAALSLVPDGWRPYTADFSIPGRFAWMLQGPEIEEYDGELGRSLLVRQYEYESGNTIPLAIVIASLRARAAGA